MAELTGRLSGAPALSAWLRAEARRPLIWGRSDCLLTPANWLMSLGLPDPAAPWRESYADAEAAGLVLGAHGGVVALMTTALAPLAAHGVRRARVPRPGSIGAVTVLGPDGPATVGGVWTGRRWAARAERGMWMGRAEALAVWRVPAGEA